MIDSITDHRGGASFEDQATSLESARGFQFSKEEAPAFSKDSPSLVPIRHYRGLPVIRLWNNTNESGNGLLEPGGAMFLSELRRGNALLEVTDTSTKEDLIYRVGERIGTSRLQADMRVLMISWGRHDAKFLGVVDVLGFSDDPKWLENDTVFSDLPFPYTNQTGMCKYWKVSNLQELEALRVERVKRVSFFHTRIEPYAESLDAYALSVLRKTLTGTKAGPEPYLCVRDLVSGDESLSLFTWHRPDGF